MARNDLVVRQLVRVLEVYEVRDDVARVGHVQDGHHLSVAGAPGLMELELRAGVKTK